MWVFDANDCALSVWHDGELKLREPGITNVIDQKPVFGLDAIHTCKNHPALCHTQYWQKLSQEPTVRKSEGITTQADLLYLHLQSIKDRCRIKDQTKFRVVVPSDVTNAQLELLYGIFQYIDLDVIDFVVVAAGLSQSDTAATHYVDVGLNRVLVSTLRASRQIEVQNNHAVSKSGYLGLLNAWTNEVARLSLEESRFDPRKFGETEQQLFNQLLDAVDTTGDVHIAIRHERGEHHFEVNALELLRAGTEVFEPINSHLTDRAVVAFSPSACVLNGLSQSITNHGHTVIHCTDEMLLSTVHEIPLPTPSKDGQPAATVHREFSYLGQVNTADGVGVTQSTVMATHVLQGSRAYPTANGFVAMDPQQASEYFRVVQIDGHLNLVPAGPTNVFLNGRLTTSDTQVAAGDRVRCGQFEYTMISVEGDG